MVDVPPDAALPAPRTAIVTGATGFIGFHLASRLSHLGWNIAAIVRPGSDPARLKLIASLPHVRIYTHRGSTAELIETVRETKPDVVFHLASRFLAQHKAEDVESLVSSNVLFPTQLVEAMVACNVKQLINTGTAWEHYENQEYNPVCLYAATKRAFEVMVEYYVQTAGLGVITLKLYDTYGPGDPRRKLFDVLHSASAGEIVKMSPGEQLLHLVYIDDVVDAFLMAAERLRGREAASAESFAVSAAKGLSLKEIAAVYEKAAGRRLSIDWGGRPYRPREVMTPWNRGALLPGWRPKVNLEDGLTRMLSSGADDVESQRP